MNQIWSNFRWYVESHSLKLLPLFLLLVCTSFYAFPFLIESINVNNPIAKIRVSAKATAEAQVNSQVEPINKTVSELPELNYQPTFINLIEPNKLDNVLNELSRYFSFP